VLRPTALHRTLLRFSYLHRPAEHSLFRRSFAFRDDCRDPLADETHHVVEDVRVAGIDVIVVVSGGGESCASKPILRGKIMTYGFRLCFKTSEGYFNSDKECLEFVAGASKIPLKLCAGNKGSKIGDSSRFVLSGGPFETEELAKKTAFEVQTALLHYATNNKLSLDLGERSLKAFSFANDFKKELSEIHQAPIVEDHRLESACLGFIAMPFLKKATKLLKLLLRNPPDPETRYKGSDQIRVKISF
jgi:hypothetical protein